MHSYNAVDPMVGARPTLRTNASHDSSAGADAITGGGGADGKSKTPVAPTGWLQGMPHKGSPVPMHVDGLNSGKPLVTVA